MCYVVDDCSTLWKVTSPKARKAHTCCACRRPIVAGTVYDRIAALTEGSWCTFTVHQECHTLARDIQLNLCGQEAYTLDGVDLHHDVLEHRHDDPRLLQRWKEILQRRLAERQAA